MPKSIGHSGFATDGAWHGEVDENNAFKIPWDRTRSRPTIDLDFPLLYGSGTGVNPLVGHWKLDDNLATTALVDETGNSSCIASDNTEDLTTTDAVAGRALSFNGVDEYIDLSDALDVITDKTKLSISFDARIDGADATETIMSIGDGVYNYLYITYSAGNGTRIGGKIDSDNDGGTPTGPYIGPNTIGQFFSVLISFDFANRQIITVINAEMSVTDSIDTAWGDGDTPTVLRFARTLYSAYGEVTIDNIKLYDGCVRPYGAFFAGNGSVEPAIADKSLLFYWDCETTAVNIPSGSTMSLSSGASLTTDHPAVGSKGLKISGGESGASLAVTANDICNFKKGMIGFWFYPDTPSVSKTLFSLMDDADNYIGLRTNWDNELECRALIEIGAVATSAASGNSWLIDANQCWIEVRWDVDEGFFKSYVNGLLDLDLTPSGTWSGDGDGVIYLGNSNYAGTTDGYFDQWFISDDPLCPSLWTVNYQPTHMPEMEIG